MKIYSTYGVSLSILLDYMSEHNLMPDWLNLCYEAFDLGFKWERLRSELYVYVYESYGIETRNNVIEILDKIDEIGFNRFRLRGVNGSTAGF